MSNPARDLESKALKLPARERARLAERLITSLDEGAEAEAEIERLWLEEAERRLDELESRQAEAVPADAVYERARTTPR